MKMFIPLSRSEMRKVSGGNSNQPCLADGSISCPTGECCSTWGYCGSTPDYCGTDRCKTDILCWFYGTPNNTLKQGTCGPVGSAEQCRCIRHEGSTAVESVPSEDCKN